MSSCGRCNHRLTPEYPEQANEQSIYQAALFVRLRRARRKAAIRRAFVNLIAGFVWGTLAPVCYIVMGLVRLWDLARGRKNEQA